MSTSSDLNCWMAGTRVTTSSKKPREKTRATTKTITKTGVLIFIPYW